MPTRALLAALQDHVKHTQLPRTSMARLPVVSYAAAPKVWRHSTTPATEASRPRYGLPGIAWPPSSGGLQQPCARGGATPPDCYDTPCVVSRHYPRLVNDSPESALHFSEARFVANFWADNPLDRANRLGRDTPRGRLTVYAAYGWASILPLLIPFFAACFLKPQAPIHI